MLAGVLVDVSGSMRDSLQLNVQMKDQHITRADSIFSTIVNIAKREVHPQDNQEMFTLAFGLPDVATCDLLSLVDYVRTLNRPSNVNGHESLIRLLANNGAPRAGEYVRNYLTENEARFLFNFYSENTDELKEIVEELPLTCKDNSGFVNVIKNEVVNRGLTLMDYGSILGICSSSSKTEKEATRQQADRATAHAKNVIRSRSMPTLRTMSMPKTKTLKSAISLLHEVVGTSSSSSSSSAEESFSTAQLSSLVNFIEPFIYGDTPMCRALQSALHMFQVSTHNCKVMFLLSDGESTDGNPVEFAQQFRDNNVLVFVCLLTSQNISHPRRLYCDSDAQWSQAQRDMFELSSTIENTHPAMSILLERKWKLPASGRSRLFVQANHPDVIDEFSSLVRHMAESNNVLLNLLGRASLDMYINISNSTFKPKD